MDNSKRLIPSHKKGTKISIKKSNEGKFTEYCGGEVTLKCIDKAKHSGNKKLVKRAVFAENARKWSKKFLNGGTALIEKSISNLKAAVNGGGLSLDWQTKALMAIGALTGADAGSKTDISNSINKLADVAGKTINDYANSQQQRLIKLRENELTDLYSKGLPSSELTNINTLPLYTTVDTSGLALSVSNFLQQQKPNNGAPVNSIITNPRR